MDNKKSSSTNIFDLTVLSGIQNEQELKKNINIVSLEDQAKLLTDYNAVNIADWTSIPKGDHIRYLRKDGSFRRGGFVLNVWVGTYGTSKDKTCIQLSSSPYYKSTKWNVCIDDIDKIWKKKSNGIIDENKDLLNV